MKVFSLILIVCLAGCSTFREVRDIDTEQALQNTQIILAASVQLLEVYQMVTDADPQMILRLQSRIQNLQDHVRRLQEMGSLRAGPPPWEDKNW